MTANEKEILRILWENAQPGIHQVQNPMIFTQQGNCVANIPLIAWVASVRGAKMHRLDISSSLTVNLDELNEHAQFYIAVTDHRL